jgi:PAS domain S-box-containing protein
LAEAFEQLHEHLRPLRIGRLGGITALRSQLDRLPVAALAADNQGRYVAVNRAAAHLTGFDARDLETKSVWEMTPDVDARMGECLWTAFLSTREQRGTYTLVTRRGTIEVVYDSRAHVLPNIHVSLLLRV